MPPSPALSAKSSARRRLRAVLVAIGALASSTVFITPNAARATDPLVPSVGRLPVLPDPATAPVFNQQMGWLILNPATRRAYQFFELQPATPARATIIQSFDLDTLAPRRRVTVQGFLPLRGAPQNPSGSGELVHAVDEEQGRLLLPMANTDLPIALNTSNDSQRPIDHLAIIDEAALDRGDANFVTKFAIPAAQAPLLTGKGLRGVALYRHDGTARLLTQWADPTPGPGPYVHMFTQWGLDRESDSWARPELTGPPCAPSRLQQGEQDRGMYQFGIAKTPAYILFGCHGSGNAAQAIRLHVDANGTPTGAIDVRPLPRAAGDVIADPARSRLLFRSVKGGTGWWVYDGDRDAWLGAVGTAVSDWGSDNSAGLDPKTGRLYTLVPNHIALTAAANVPVSGGLSYTDNALTPVPQLTNVRRDLAYPGMFRIAVDPAKGSRPTRLFVRRGAATGICFADDGTQGSTCSPQVENHYLVIEDRRPVAEQADASSADRFTVNVDEREGITGANFDRGGIAYGTRLLYVGGLSAATTREFDQPPLRHGSACVQSDREIVFGYVKSARATNVSAAAVAAGIAVDAATSLDLEDPAHKCWPTPTLGQGVNVLGAIGPWPQPPDLVAPGHKLDEVESACTGDNGVVEKENKDTPGQASETAVDCQQSKGTVSARSEFAFTEGAVTVGHTKSSLKMEKDSTGRMVTTVTAEARNIAFEGVSIGLVRSTGKAWAAGRPKTADADFTRDICNVVVGDAMSEPGCLSAEQRQQFVTLVNQRMAGRGEIRLREPDEAYIDGTPGGFQAAVERKPAEQFTDTLVTRDFAKPVPALELIFYRDDGSLGAGRQVYQFGGVEVSSQYGIYCLKGSNAAGTACNVDLGDPPILDDDTTPTGVFNETVLDSDPTSPVVSTTPTKKESPVKRFFRRLAALPGDALRLILSNPGDALLLLGVWSLVWLPCLLGERRKAASRLVATQIAGGSQ